RGLLRRPGPRPPQADPVAQPGQDVGGVGVRAGDGGRRRGAIRRLGRRPRHPGQLDVVARAAVRRRDRRDRPGRRFARVDDEAGRRGEGQRPARPRVRRCPRHYRQPVAGRPVRVPDVQPRV
ncbi:MAG: Phosphatidate cytidylyltransferase, partial [uncultured Phycisphaerae bacterium]